MRELDDINGLLDEINYLKKRSQLLDEILRYYNRETMSIDVPAKWKETHRLSDEMKAKTPKTPRHALSRKMCALLPVEEWENLVDTDKINENIK